MMQCLAPATDERNNLHLDPVLQLHNRGSNILHRHLKFTAQKFLHEKAFTPLLTFSARIWKKINTWYKGMFYVAALIVDYIILLLRNHSFIQIVCGKKSAQVKCLSVLNLNSLILFLKSFIVLSFKDIRLNACYVYLLSYMLHISNHFQEKKKYFVIKHKEKLKLYINFNISFSKLFI